MGLVVVEGLVVGLVPGITLRLLVLLMFHLKI